MSKAPIGFYGDDFTGATAHLAGFQEHGLKGLLFLFPPTDAMLQAELRDLDVVGIAGISRSLDPERMEQEVRPAFELLKRAGCRQVHYKVCSTFDSAPHVGSIGHVIGLGRDVFGEKPAPVVVGCPRFGRYVVFGNLFARTAQGIFRLDRHPTMSRHPSTPMDESDLALHLARQTPLSVDGIDRLCLGQGAAALASEWRRMLDEAVGAVVFDTLDDGDLDQISMLLEEQEPSGTVFCVAAQGLAESVGRREAAGRPRSRRKKLAGLKDARPMLALSGSASPQNAAQIEWALAQGWTGIRIDPWPLLAAQPEAQPQGTPRRFPPDGAALHADALHAGAAQRNHVSEEMLRALRAGRNVVIYTALGPDDPSLDRIKSLRMRHGLDEDAVASGVGAFFARLMNDAVEHGGLRRLVLAGGDTSSHAMRGVDAYALGIIANARHGGRLCRLKSLNPSIDGVEVMLKGGQVGGVTVFTDASLADNWIPG